MFFTRKESIDGMNNDILEKSCDNLKSVKTTYFMVDLASINRIDFSDFDEYKAGDGKFVYIFLCLKSREFSYDEISKIIKNKDEIIFEDFGKESEAGFFPKVFSYILNSDLPNSKFYIFSNSKLVERTFSYLSKKSNIELEIIQDKLVDIESICETVESIVDKNEDIIRKGNSEQTRFSDNKEEADNFELNINLEMLIDEISNDNKNDL